MTAMESRAFTESQAARVTNMSSRRLARWARVGLVEPSISRRAGLSSRAGRGRHRRVYTYQDLVGLAIAADLSRTVRWLPELKKAVDHLRALNYRDPLAELPFWVWRGRVYFSEADTIRAGRQPEQTIMPFTVEVGHYLNDLAAAIESLDARRPGTIERRRGALGHKPLLAGTRIPVQSVKRLIRDGVRPDRVPYYYPDLTAEDVEAALAS
jgi:uncharacterized protein (DUF433 family)